MKLAQFVNEKIGMGFEDFINYFDSDLSNLSSECGIDWEKTKSNILYDGQTNSGKETVFGITKADQGRVYIWATYEKSKAKFKGESFYFPKIVFKNYREGMNQVGKYFDGLTEAIKEFNLFSEDALYIKKAKPKKLFVENQDLLAAEKNKKNEALKVITRKEKKSFSSMLLISDKKSFSKYLLTKKVQKIAKDKKLDIRIGKDNNGYFAAFALYKSGGFHSLQRIYNENINSDVGNKLSSSLINPMGSYALFGASHEELKTLKIIYIGEGLATMLSILEASNEPVIVCMFADNIEAVAKAIIEINPEIVIVFVADNDNETLLNGNTGVYKSSLACKKYGGWVFVPFLKESKSDGNEVHVKLGIDELVRQLGNKYNYFNTNFSLNVSGRFNYIYDQFLL